VASVLAVELELALALVPALDTMVVVEDMGACGGITWSGICCCFLPDCRYTSDSVVSSGSGPDLTC
jgi:hypothetical protein